MIRIKAVVFGSHALEKIDGLGIGIEDVEQIIRKGMKWRDKMQTNKWYANMHNYEVVFEELDDVLYVITVYAAEVEQ